MTYTKIVDSTIRMLLIDSGQIEPNENFYPINDFPNYFISPYGKVFSAKTNRLLKPWVNNEYFSVTLTHNGYRQIHTLHRLVAIHFVPNPLDKPCVNHIDHDNHNNVWTNLEWVTIKEHKEITNKAIRERGTLRNPKRNRHK